jgi:nitroreductase
MTIPSPKLAFLLARRSIRVFRPGPVGEELVEGLLQAAMAAPSAVAKDPWRFIVVREKATLARMADILPNGQMLREAELAIVVCGDLEAAHDRLLSYLLQDCSAAIENLLLAAYAFGLGACWLGIHPREERIRKLSELFGLPGTVIPISGIALGWPGEKKEARTRYNAAYVHRERWGAS